MIRKCFWLAGLALASSSLSAAPFVRVTTSMGDFTLEVNPQRAPLTTDNFLKYVKEGFYDGTLFHRVVANFVVQGGGYAAADKKLKKPHDSIPNESGNGLQNSRGTVGLARAEGAHSGNSQFYVNLVDNPELDPVPTRWGYAVFGKVVQGMDVVDRIGVMPTGAVAPFKSDSPLQPVIIQKVVLLTAGPGSAEAPAGTSTPPPTDVPAPPVPEPAPTSPAGEAPSSVTPPPAQPETRPPGETPPGT
jgi:cyclophilin family peptidyl-prolyl cis-trans isomerase